MIKRAFGFLLVALLLAGALLSSQRRHESPKVSGFLESDEIRIGSRVGGRVMRVAAEEGRRVKKGEILVELEPHDLLQRKTEAEAVVAARRAELQKRVAGFRPEEIAQAKARRDQIEARLQKLIHGPRREEIAAAAARLELAEAELKLARLAHERVQALYERKVASQDEYDRATQEFSGTEARRRASAEELALLKAGTRAEEIDEARAQLEESEQAWKLQQSGNRSEDLLAAKAALDQAEASLAALEKQIEELSIRAPIEGVVEALELQPGDLVGANAPVLSIMDVSRLWVRAYVPENMLNIKIGQQLSLTVDSVPDERFKGTVTFIAREAEFTPGNVQTPEDRSKQVFRIKVTLDEGLDRLRPGMAADVWLAAPEARP